MGFRRYGWEQDATVYPGRFRDLIKHIEGTAPTAMRRPQIMFVTMFRTADFDAHEIEVHCPHPTTQTRPVHHT